MATNSHAADAADRPRSAGRTTRDRTIVVVAHPDDEALWFTSVLREAARIIICFRDAAAMPECTAGRQRALAEFPLPTVHCLGVDESGSFEAADWLSPVETPAGLRVVEHDGIMAGFTVDAYERGFRQLVSGLRPMLEGATVVYTHNPWGEYGHEDHVQVFRAVDSLRREMSFEQRFGLVASEKSAALMARYLGRLPDPVEVRQTDRALGEELRALYRRHKVWTWFPDNAWPADERFVTWNGEGVQRQRGHTVPIQMIHIGWTSSPLPVSGPGRRLVRRVASKLRSIANR